MASGADLTKLGANYVSLKGISLCQRLWVGSNIDFFAIARLSYKRGRVNFFLIFFFLQLS